MIHLQQDFLCDEAINNNMFVSDQTMFMLENEIRAIKSYTQLKQYLRQNGGFSDCETGFYVGALFLLETNQSN